MEWCLRVKTRKAEETEMSREECEKLGPLGHRLLEGLEGLTGERLAAGPLIRMDDLEDDSDQILIDYLQTAAAGVAHWPSCPRQASADERCGRAFCGRSQPACACASSDSLPVARSGRGAGKNNPSIMAQHLCLAMPG